MRNDLREAREDLAAALIYADKLGLSEGICNHFSLAVSDDGEEFLVNPQGLHWSELTASDIILCHKDGRVLDGKHPVEATAYFIHAPIHAGNPAAKAVLHTHMPYATSLTLVEEGRLEMVEQGGRDPVRRPVGGAYPGARSSGGRSGQRWQTRGPGFATTGPRQPVAGGLCRAGRAGRSVEIRGWRDFRST